MTGPHPWLVRHVTYPLWQRRHGGTVLPTLARLERTQWLPPVELETLQVSRLRPLLTHAYAHSPFYKDAFSSAGVGPQDIQTLADLRHLPVLEKADLRDHCGSLVTNGSPLCTLVKRQTSGSTGIPVVLWAGPRARDAWVAAGFRLLRWWDVNIGDRRLTLISRHNLTRRGWLKQYAFANVLEYSAMDLSEAALARVYDRLTRGSVRLLMGYPSSLAYLAQYVISSGGARRLTLRAVVTTGEVLHGDQRVLLRRAFRCPVVDEYGSSETGHIAGECPQGRMHIAAENVVVECERSDPGELLITDLTNVAMPLIRYRIGDLGALGEPCPCGRGLPVLHLRVGRTADLVVLPGGRRMDFSVFAGVFEDVAARGIPLRQYRVIQHAVDHFEVLLAGPARLSGAEDLVRQRIQLALQARVNVAVRVVADIPPDPTGKRRRFISQDAGPAEYVSVTPET